MDAAERAAKIFIRRYEALNEEYLEIIGERIRAIGRVSPTDLYRLERLRDIGTDMEKLKRKLASETGKSLKELEKLLRQAADAAMKPYDGLMNAEPYLRNEIAEAMAAAQYIETTRAMVNLSNTTVSSASYQGLVDRAVSAVQLGTESYQSAIRSMLRGAAWDGLCVVDGTRKVRYASGLTRRLDTAARQNVLDGFRALMQRTRDETGKAFGADGVEISAHMLCAEDHLPYQGRQFSLEEFERLNQTLRRPIAKGIWNCSHVAEPIVLGISEPAYTDEELAEYRRSSVEQVTIDGKTRSRYQWTQEQRRIETAIRREKDVAIAAKAAGDDVLRRQCQQRINDYRKHYDRISKDAGLEVRTDKMTVSGFHRVRTAEELLATRKKHAFEQARADIQSGKITKKINREKQARHMAGDKGYIEGRSVITVPIERLQELVDKYAGTGKVIVSGKDLDKITEEVDFHEKIGYTVNREGGTYETTWVKIHYGRTGDHAVPFRRDDDGAI